MGLSNGRNEKNQGVTEENRELYGMNSLVIVSYRKTRIDANSFGAEQTKDILDDARERVKKRKNEENQSHDK